MMKDEFEQRFGTIVSHEIYNKIETLYMQTKEDKDTFVKRIKKENTVITIQAEMIKEMESKLSELKEYMTATKKSANISLENEQNKTMHKAGREKLVEGSQEYYGYNRYTAALHNLVLSDNALEIIER